GDRRGYRKNRAAAGIGIERDAVVEDARQALDDGKAKPQAARDPRALLQTVKFLENLAPLERGNADAGVVDANLEQTSAPAATDQHASMRGVFDGVGDEVLQQATQQQAIGFDRKRAGHEAQPQALGARDRSELDLQRTHEVADLEARDRGCHGAGIKPRNVEQGAQYLLDRLK